LVILARLLLPTAPQSPVSVFNIVPEEPLRTPLHVSIPMPPPEGSTLKHSVSTSQLYPIIWALGIALILARVLQQHWRVRGWVRNGKATTHPALEEARFEHGLRKTPALKIVSQIQVPALFGFFRPTILLPEQLAQSPNLKLIFLHELAHVRRRHVLINWIIIIAQAIHWFNPLVWLALRRLRSDQEILCDLDVVRIIGERETQSYGETLLALASNATRPLPTVLPISTSFKQMKERIRMLTTFKPVTKRLIVLGAVLALTLSVATFTRAVDAKPVEKRSAESRKTRITDEERTSIRLNLLRNEMERLTAEVESREDELSKLRERIPNPAILEGRESEEIKQLERDRILADGERVKIDRIYESLKTKPKSELRDAIPTTYPDDRLNDLLTTLAKTDQQLAVFSKDYSDDHPEVQRLRSVRKTIDAQIEHRTEGILSGLKITVQARTDVAEILARKIMEFKKRDSESLGYARNYIRVKRDLETMQKVRDNLHMRLLQEEIESRIPKD